MRMDVVLRYVGSVMLFIALFMLLSAFFFEHFIKE